LALDGFCTTGDLWQVVKTESGLQRFKPLDQPSSSLARIPAKWNHFAEKDSRQINTLEQI
jgi:hypothetical protein